MLNSIRDRIRYRNASVQFELQRMTAAGGWVNFYGDAESSQTPTAFDEPLEPPTFDASSGYPEGRYRCIRRVDGRIESVRWTVESPACEQYYAAQRDEQRQRERLAALPVGEISAERQAGAFTKLDRMEILEAMIEKQIDVWKDDR